MDRVNAESNCTQHTVEQPYDEKVVYKYTIQRSFRLAYSLPISRFPIPGCHAHREAHIFEKLAQLTILVHCGDVIGPADRLAV